jgi:hypothetical protein
MLVCLAPLYVTDFGETWYEGNATRSQFPTVHNNNMADDREGTRRQLFIFK